MCRKNSLILKMFAPKNWWWVSKPILVIDLGPCPTLGRSIFFLCCQLQYAAQEVMMSISAYKISVGVQSHNRVKPNSVELS